MLKIPFVIRWGVVAVVFVIAACPTVRAALNVRGDVTTLPTFEFITPSEVDTDNITAQLTWEKNKDIVVGVKLLQGGRLEIDGTTEVRYQNLIIGSQGLQNGLLRKGSGSVLIFGDGALYSNDPTSIPPQYEGTGFASDPSVARDPDVGFDLIVGEWGQGRLDIVGEGRAEIQDAVVVGSNPGSSGVLRVSGVGSMLGHGGFNSNDDTPHQMLIGRQGMGQMYITDGGLVVSEAPSTVSTGDDIVGAVIGSDIYNPGTSVTQIPELGGFGEVTVSGLSSRWVIGGSLQIGGFHYRATGATLEQQLSGSTVNYNGVNGQPGRGTLIIEANSLVKVRNSLGVTTPDNQELRLMIGRFGTLDLRGGLIAVGDGIEPTDSTPNEVEVLNDGVIRGSGRIETGVFRNRYYGQVRVGQGESLVIDSTSEFLGTLVQENYPLFNFGLIEVLGTEDQPAALEFVRPPAGTVRPLTPLINRPVATTVQDAPTTFDGGLISAQNARLRFTSGDSDDPNGAIGMKNEGVMAFTAGTNIITGAVVNQKGIDANALNPKFLIGPNTTVVVEDDFTVDSAVVGPGPVVNGPIFDLGQGASLIVLDQSTLTLAGALNLNVSLSNPSSIDVSGDLGLGGALNATLANDALASLGHGSAFEILSFDGQAYGIDASGPVAKPNTTPIPQGGSGFTQVNISPDINTLFPNLDAVVQRSGQGFFLSFLDPTLIGVGASFADFDGNGVVDQADLAIWQANMGITSGASILQGDADGDGDVDGNDYLEWLEQFTNGGVPGSPVPSSSPAAVPEPAGLAMMSIGAMLALAYRRRRG